MVGNVRPVFQSPANSGGNDGALPTTYDPMWPAFTNLSPQQILAFQAFPQDLTMYAANTRWRKEIADLNPIQGFITVNSIPVSMSEASRSLLLGLARAADRNINGGSFSFTDNGSSFTLTAAQGIALVDAVMSYIQKCRDIEASLFSGINATPPTITTRAQINAAFAVVPTSF